MGEDIPVKTEKGRSADRERERARVGERKYNMDNILASPQCVVQLHMSFPPVNGMCGDTGLLN